MTYPAGNLLARVRIERRAETADAYGNVEGVWQDQGSLPCGLKPGRSLEAVEAGRLEPQAKCVITMHNSPRARAILTSDRFVVTGGPWRDRILNIRAVLPMTDAATIEFQCEEGVAT